MSKTLGSTGKTAGKQEEQKQARKHFLSTSKTCADKGSHRESSRSKQGHQQRKASSWRHAETFDTRDDNEQRMMTHSSY